MTEFQTPIINITGSILLALAVLHTFCTSYFQKTANRYPEGSIQENFFHLLGEVEVVFGLWAGILVCFLTANLGWTNTMTFIDQINFSEPIFVFAIMTVASTKPIIDMASKLILGISSKLPMYQTAAMYFLCLTLGPLLGSLITEPAAMTVTALILLTQFYSHRISERFQYITLAVLFVNVSIGGVLTHYAAPPVLMVADIWGWTTPFMFATFGWKAVLAIFLNTTIAASILFKELCQIEIKSVTQEASMPTTPYGLTLIHLFFLALVVMTSHHPAACMGSLLFFIGLTTVTAEYQDDLKIRQSLLVAFFLAGLVILGQFQSWWLNPLLGRLDELALFMGATALTAFTDNAALTYLGAQVSGVSDMFKYALVAGAVAGGGLTVIANAPNPAGFSILQKSFGPNGIQPGKLFVYALIPTLIAMFCFWIL